MTQWYGGAADNERAPDQKGARVGRLDSDAEGCEEERSGEDGMNGITLDTCGLIALDRDDRKVVALVVRAIECGVRITVPATALAQAIRKPAKQARRGWTIRVVFEESLRLFWPPMHSRRRPRHRN